MNSDLRCWTAHYVDGFWDVSLNEQEIRLIEWLRDHPEGTTIPEIERAIVVNRMGPRWVDTALAALRASGYVYLRNINRVTYWFATQEDDR